MPDTKNQITDVERDQLAEMVNIGAGNASTALSHMIGKKIQMTVPESFIGSMEDIQRRLGKSDDTVLAVFLKVYGDTNGAMLMIFSEESAVNFTSVLIKKHKESLKDFDDFDFSAVQEAGNILLGASITALGKFLNISMLHSIPDVAVDMLAAVMDTVMIEMAGKDEKILAFKVDMSVEKGNIMSELYFIFDPVSSAKILELAKKKIS